MYNESQKPFDPVDIGNSVKSVIARPPMLTFNMKHEKQRLICEGKGARWWNTSR